jgi:hypothetical protein
MEESALFEVVPICEEHWWEQYEENNGFVKVELA